MGAIEDWLLDAGYDITNTRLDLCEEMPDIDSIDLLIIMGGPMSVHDELEHPWLKREKDYIKKVIEVGKPTLGICLGAQLIAQCMGAEVFANGEKEIGWWPIQAHFEDFPGPYELFKFPGEVDVFHWHGETFSLPQGAALLAKSKACQNQAFQIGEHVIALQFHLETTRSSAQALVNHCGGELVNAQYIQPDSEILSDSPEKYSRINHLMAEVLSFLLK
ncbi:MAG: amidotransferase [Planctomycetes bacterium]|nr:amidotransferase [Planctomycetota bacterium]